MFNIKPIIAALAALLLLNACGSSNTDVTAGSSLSIFAESTQTSPNNVRVDITGTWKTSCYQEGSNTDQIDVLIIAADGEIQVSKEQYLTTGSVCTGSLSESIFFPTDSDVGASVSRDTEFTMIGWVNGNGDLVSAPANAAGTGDLTAQPDTTRLDINDAGSIYNDTYYLDDTGANHVLYRGNDLGNGFVQHISIADPYFKQ